MDETNSASKIKVVAKHPRPIRWMHWLNVPLLGGMIWSGLLIYWANDEYRIGVGNWTLFHFFPDWCYRLLGLRARLAEGMAWHFTLMWFFALNGICYVLYTTCSGEWRALVPGRASWGHAWHTVLHDLRLRTDPPPRWKFNGAQQFAYTGVILMGFGSLLTGLAIYKPTQLAWLTEAFGGYRAARYEHFCLTCGYVAFVVVHLAQVVRAGWNNFRAMAIGVEVREEGASDE